MASQQQVNFIRGEQESKIRIEDLVGKTRHLETQLRIKEDEIYKLRQDNSNMFNDLKQFAQGDESLKGEVAEHKSKRLELEMLNDDLRERS